MSRIHHHPDDIIYLNDGVVSYEETLVNFLSDINSASLPPYPSIPSGFRERSYDGKFCIIFSQSGSTNIEHEVWEIGDGYLKNISRLVQEKVKRNMPHVPLKPSLNDLKSQSIQSVYEKCSVLRIKVAGTSDPVKLASFSNYRIMLEKYHNNEISDWDLAAIDVEIKFRGLNESRSEFFDKVRNNARRYSYACGVITGLERKAIDKISLAQTTKDIDDTLQELNLSLAGVA